MNRNFAKTKILILAALCICLLNTSIPAQDDSSRTVSSIIQLPKELNLEDMVYEDINQDGLKDIALSVSNPKKDFERSLRIHYQKNDILSFVTESDETISLTSDVIAYAFAEIDKNPGTELILFTANACFGYRLNAENENKVYKIEDVEFLWQIPDPHNVFSWQSGILDFNNDGRMDFVLPQSDGIKIFLQEETGFAASQSITPPETTITQTTQYQLGNNNNRSNSGSALNMDSFDNLLSPEKKKKPLVNVSHAINKPAFIDFDGNNLSDILIKTKNSIYVLEQEENKPLVKDDFIKLNIPKDFDIDNENQYILDLNKDKLCDSILFARDTNSKNVYTHILVYINHKNSENEDIIFDEDGIPKQVIKIAGLPGKVQLDDINCDGYPDLSFITFNPDLLDQVKTITSKSIKIQFLAFINNKGEFSRKPEINKEIDVVLDDKINSERDYGRFFMDFDNDGLLDVIVRDESNHIGLRLLKKTKNGIDIPNKNVWDMTIPENTEIIYEKKNNDTKPELLIKGTDQVIHVRFK